MSESTKDKNYDFAAFSLAGNTLIKLVEKGVIDIRDAKDVIDRTRATNKFGSSLKCDVIGSPAEDCIDSLFLKLWDSKPLK